MFPMQRNISTLFIVFLCSYGAQEPVWAQEISTSGAISTRVVDENSTDAQQALGETDFTQPVPLGTQGTSASSNLDTNRAEKPVRLNLRTPSSAQVGRLDARGQTTTLVNSPTIPVQGGADRKNIDPYAALGLRAGSFTVFPVLTQAVGYTTNADLSSDGNAAAFSQTTLSTTAISDWSRHELQGTLEASKQKFLNSEAPDFDVYQASVDLRLDLMRRWTLRFGGTAAARSEGASDPNSLIPEGADVNTNPVASDLEFFAESENQFGRVETRIRGSIARLTVSSAKLSDGTVLPQSERNSTTAEVSSRVLFETSPALKPFVDVSLANRQMDHRLDSAGFARDSVRYALRVGFEFDQGEKHKGEVSLGYGVEEFEDVGLANLGGLLFDGTWNWSPQRGTVVSSKVQTAFDPSFGTTESGSISYSGQLGITREIAPGFSLNSRISAAWRTYEGSDQKDTTWQLGFGAEKDLNRFASLFANADYQKVNSTDTGSEYEAATVLLGVRLKR